MLRKLALLAEEVDPVLPAGDEGPEPAPGLEQVGSDILDRDRRLPLVGGPVNSFRISVRTI
jgi:hypothetical protein